MNILIVSDSKVLMDEELKKIIKDSSNKITYNYNEVDLKTILEEAGYVSMFQDMKYVIVKNANFFSKEKITDSNCEALINYLNSPNPYTTLIFTTYEEVDKRKKIYKKYQELGKIVELKAPSNYELFKVVKSLVMQKGYLIDDEEVRFIINACLGNYDLIYNEIEKLTLLFKENSKISLATLKELISTNVKDNQFKFIDAVINKNISLAFSLLNDLKSLKVEPLQLINLLAREYRLMIMTNLLSKKANFNQIMQELKLADWQLQKIIKNNSLYHLDDLKDNLLDLAKLDYEIKAGLKDKWLSFESFLIKIFEY